MLLLHYFFNSKIYFVYKMNQLKFIRSKSTAKHSPHGKQLLKKVSKPGKLNVSVGKSRQSS